LGFGTGAKEGDAQMSIMSCTYASAALDGEITLIITMPEKSSHELLPFSAIVLVPDTAMESNFFMRKKPLERYGGGRIPIATVSLPGRVAMHSPSALLTFLADELPAFLGHFPLKIIALYAEGRSAIRLLEIKDTIKDCYTNLRMNTLNEPLKDYLDDLKENLHSAKL
jgi:hypothetical protein